MPKETLSQEEKNLLAEKWKKCKNTTIHAACAWVSLAILGLILPGKFPETPAWVWYTLQAAVSSIFLMSLGNIGMQIAGIIHSGGLDASGRIKMDPGMIRSAYGLRKTLGAIAGLNILLSLAMSIPLSGTVTLSDTDGNRATFPAVILGPRNEDSTEISFWSAVNIPFGKKYEFSADEEDRYGITMDGKNIQITFAKKEMEG